LSDDWICCYAMKALNNSGDSHFGTFHSPHQWIIVFA
jgi:hypothetical protein